MTLNQPDHSTNRPASSLISSPGEWILLGGLVLVALLLRGLMVGLPPLHPDELHYVFDTMAGEETGCLQCIRGLECSMLVERRTAHPMLVPLLTRWLWFLPLGWAVDWTPGFWRGFNVLAGALLLLPAMYIGRVVGGARGGWIAALLAATGPGLVWISRTAYLDPVYTLLIAAWIAAVAHGWRTGNTWGTILQGVLFGLVLSTKISAPMLVPAFAVGLLLAPTETSWRQRIRMLALGGGVAMVVWVILCDPASYWNAIIHPTDVRYRDTWEREGATGLANLLIVYLRYYATIAVWDVPITVLAPALVSIFLLLKARNPFGWFLVVVLVCLMPLVLLHHPRLSGAHGFMPLHLVLALTSLTAFLALGRWLIPLLAIHLLFITAAVGLRNHESLPLSPSTYHVIDRSEHYDLAREWLHNREDPRTQILILEDYLSLLFWVNSIRMAQLSEGAIILTPISDRIRPTIEAWQWADIVMVADSFADLAEPTLSDFKKMKRADRIGYTVYHRVSGTARRSVQLDEVPGSPDGENVYHLSLPGLVHPLSGRWVFGGIHLKHEGGSSPFFSGMVPFEPPGDLSPSELEITIMPPSRRDVLWGF